MTAALAVGLLVAGGTYLVLQRGLLRVVLGFVLLGHGVNVLVVAAGGMHRREAPLLARADPATAADPLPQAFVLTAIVITFAITVYLLGLLRTGDAGAGRPDKPHSDPGDGRQADPAGGPAREPEADRDGADPERPEAGGRR